MVLWTLIVFFFLVIIGIPIAFSFGLGALFHWAVSDPSNTIVVVTKSFGSLDSFSLMAIPLFILAGDIMKEGAISRHLINLINGVIGKIKGALAHVTVIASLFFGAISGSAAATVAAIGGIMIPEMIKKGYSRENAVVVSAASGFLGVLIPPSIPLIIYGFNAEVSIAKLFLGGIVPGILMAVGFLIVNRFMYNKQLKNIEASASLEEVINEVPRETISPDPKGKNSFKKNLINAIPALLMPVIVLGGIYSGVFTPTESGAVAALYGILVSVFLYRSIGLKKLVFISGNSALMSAVILLIIGLAGVFGWLITTEQVPMKLAEAVTNITSNPYIILLMLNVIYLILGTFLETITAIVITTPIFLPLILAVGIDPIHFGIIQTVNLSVGLITPPMALNLLMASKIGNIPILQTVRALIPYFIVAIIVVLIVTYVPAVVLFLPNLL
ncbi:TRAP transporter large permease [Mesobacillus maritimus]|uniref:TRAP transporter large permease n=1 Tax=Mesobacillus maritimus TaxID=1643336 RepID=UPI00203BB851|nr:TRAP transporter large permease [Mesobacillus maritimus]MCM3584980.1 TRAP transporter large permease [Mesobacillus maritimus]